MTQGMVYRNQNYNLDMIKYDHIHNSIFDPEKVKAYDHPDPANMIGTVSRGLLILNVL